MNPFLSSSLEGKRERGKERGKETGKEKQEETERKFPFKNITIEQLPFISRISSSLSLDDQHRHHHHHHEPDDDDDCRREKILMSLLFYSLDSVNRSSSLGCPLFSCLCFSLMRE